MGVQLNIKDAELVRMAKELAGGYDGNVTAALRAAVRDALAAREAEIQRRVAEMQAIVAEMRPHWKPEFDGVELSTAHGDLLYDEYGAPI